MKNLQRNLFVVLALALCGLCAYQWHDQVIQREAIETLNQQVFDRNTSIQGYTNSLATLNHQVEEFDAQLTALKKEAETNADLMADQKRALTRLTVLNSGYTNQLGQYKQAVDTLESRLQAAYDGIKKQNATLVELAAQRDQMAAKYNAEIKDRNDVVEKYNELVEEIKKAQAVKN